MRVCAFFPFSSCATCTIHKYMLEIGGKRLRAKNYYENAISSFIAQLHRHGETNLASAQVITSPEALLRIDLYTVIKYIYTPVFTLAIALAVYDLYLKVFTDNLRSVYMSTLVNVPNVLAISSVCWR